MLRKLLNKVNDILILFTLRIKIKLIFKLKVYLFDIINNVLLKYFKKYYFRIYLIKLFIACLKNIIKCIQSFNYSK